MLRELSEDLNTIKKIQSTMKDTLIEILKKLQENNIRMNEAKNQINDMENKEEKTTTQNKKKESKKMRIV